MSSFNQLVEFFTDLKDHIQSRRQSQPVHKFRFIFFCLAIAFDLWVFGTNVVCLDDEQLDRVSSLWGPGSCLGWLLVAITFIALHDLEPPWAGSELIPTPDPLTFNLEKLQVNISADLVAVLAYPVIACFSFLYQVATSPWSATHEATSAVVLLGSMLSTIVMMCRPRGRVTWRFSLWFYLNGLCYGTMYTHIMVQAKIIDSRGGFVELISRWAARFFFNYIVAGVTPVPELVMHIALILIAEISRAIKESRNIVDNVCQNSQVRITFPRTDASWSDLDQAVPLGLSLLTVCWTIHHHYASRPALTGYKVLTM